MKRIVSVLVFLTVLSLASAAQTRSVGLRLGDGLEVSYQKDSKIGFLEMDFGVIDFAPDSSLRLGASYDFTLFRKTLGEGNIVMFLGPGASVQLFGQVQFAVSAYAQLGVEYDFKGIPLEIALDTRPGVWYVPGSSAVVIDLAILIPTAAVRWRF